MYSAFAIGKTGDPKALDILSPYIENESEDLNIRLWSIAGLGYLSGDTVTEKLIAFAKVDNVRIRLEAVKALGKLKSNAAQDILAYKALYDPEPAVMKEAKTALQNMGVDLETLGKNQTNMISLKTTAPVSTNKISTNMISAVLTNKVSTNIISTMHTNAVSTNLASTVSTNKIQTKNTNKIQIKPKAP